MYVVVNTIRASAAELDRMSEAFRESAGDMTEFEGFLDLELWRDAESLLVVSRWTTRDAFLQYPRSEAFRRHHARMTRDQAITAAQITTYHAEKLI